MAKSSKKIKRSSKSKAPAVSRNIIITLGLSLIILLIFGGLFSGGIGFYWLILSSMIIIYPAQLINDLLSGFINGAVISEILTISIYFLYFLLLGFIVGISGYRKFGKNTYWSILIIIPNFLLNLFAALFSDSTFQGSFLAVLDFFLLFAFIASSPFGFILGIYLASKVFKKSF